jgi:hypothetical protein
MVFTQSHNIKLDDTMKNTMQSALFGHPSECLALPEKIREAFNHSGLCVFLSGAGHSHSIVAGGLLDTS